MPSIGIVRVMTERSAARKCVSCGEPIGDCGGLDSHKGEQVTCEIVEQDDALVITREVEPIVEVHRKWAASTLTRELRVGMDDLVGRRFTYIAIPMAFGGQLFTDFRLVPDCELQGSRRVAEALRNERLGHHPPGIYEHPTIGMRETMADRLQALWESLRAVETRADDDDRRLSQIRNA